MTADVPKLAGGRDEVATGARPAIEISHLHKTYGETIAVDDVSFSVAEGDIFGLLGPNGAGKTTTVECAVGLRRADSGSVRVLGLDPTRDRDRLRVMVGVQLQSSALQAKLKVGELLDLYQSFYPEPADGRELAEVLGLADKRNEYYRSLSGGQKQRLSIALALIGQPKVAVLDEMTTGLDPHARRDTWDLIEQVRDRGVSIVLVTHYMEEAERLCDQVALIDRGRVVAAGTPEELTLRAGGGRQMQFMPSGRFDDRLLTELPEVSGVEHHGRRVHLRGSGDLVNAVIQTLTAAGVTAHDVEVTSPNLEDAFVELTGRRLASDPQPPPPRRGRGRSGSREQRSLLPKGTPRRAFVKLVQNEARLAWRTPVGLIVGLALPVLLLVLFRNVPIFNEGSATFGGHSYFDVSLPILIALVIAVPALFSLPTPLATYREQGILRRLSATPVPPSWVLGAQLVVNACIAVAALVILMVLGTVGFGLKTQSLGGLILSIILSGTAVFGIGLWITGIARTATVAGGIAWLTFYPLMFFTGLFVPRQLLPAVVVNVGDWTPLGAGVDALQRSMLNGFPSTTSLLVLAAYSMVFGWLAVRYFRWE
jgi:ABC-2 type transport system ATP-binding protein